jgi:hypothetical protein
VARAVKIRCDEVWSEVSNYLEDEVSAGLRTRMEQHFKSCKRCTAVLVGTRNVVRLVGDAAILDLLAAFNDRFDQKFDGELSERCQSRKEE